ncbi:MAG: phosphate ABC transporter permease family protein, partial [Hyphomicrobiales bacterium]
MAPVSLLAVLLLLSIVAYYVGRRKAFALAGRAAGFTRLHSQPAYHGALVALWCAIPALLIFGFWLVFETPIITELVVKNLPETIRTLPPDRLNLVVNDIRNLESGTFVSPTVDPALQAAADHYRRLRSISHHALAVITIALMAAAAMFVRSRIAVGLRARNHVEGILTIILLACSTIAIFTTIGIILSILYEAIRFFKVVPITDFLFGLEWSPQMAIRAD